MAARTPQLPTVHRRSRVWRRWSWWMAGVVALVAQVWLNPAFMQRFDLMAYDLLVPTRPAMEQSPVIIAIDDASLNELGRWPWPRSRHAAMVDRLAEAGAGAIGMVVLFGEPDLTDPAGDAALAAAVARAGRVVLPVAPAFLANGRLDPGLLVPAWASTVAPSAAMLGHVDVEMDLDGQVRRLYLMAGNGRADLPALALAVSQQVDDNKQRVTERQSLPGARAGLTSSPAQSLWVRDHEVLLPRMRGLPTLSFVSVLRDPGQLAGVQGRAVFVGVTASGLGGELVMPLAGHQSMVSSVEFHAQAYAALAQHATLTRASVFASVFIALFVLSGLAWWPRTEGRQVLWASSLLGVPLLVSALALYAARWWLPPALATLVLGVGLTVWLAARFQVAGRQLAQSRQHSLATLQAIGDGVITLDPSGQTILYANPAAMSQVGRLDLAGLPLHTVFRFAAESGEHLQSAIDDCLRQQRRVTLHEPLSLPSPSAAAMRYLRVAVNPLSSPEGQLDGVVLVLSDVTTALAAARDREYAATHDALTGLPNRVLLQERLVQVLARTSRHGSSAAILFLDLDRFKHINDSLGHSTGDEVLRIVARRLQRLTRDTDMVARWGGDEFVVVLEDLADQAGVTAAASKIVEVLSRDIDLDDTYGNLRLPCAVSVGVVVAPQDGADVEDLLSKADMAMYRAKAQPQAAFHFWSDDSNIGLQARLALEIDLRQGLREGQFVLYYQPQFAFDDGRLVGMEALMRWWRRPDVLVMPNDFIGVAEGSGLIVDMGAWAVKEVARQIATWLAAGLQPVPVAVNVSARQCLNRDLIALVGLALKETGIPPQMLRLEITETTAMSDSDQVLGLLQSIRAMGVGLVLDDFGTGFSSLAHLKRFPVDELKIDRSFVTDVATNQSDLAIVRATIALAHGLGIRVVAEGIETAAQSQVLAHEHCDVAQGYLYAFPQPVNDVAKLLLPTI